jgi:hypothetical protein
VEAYERCKGCPDTFEADDMPEFVKVGSVSDGYWIPAEGKSRPLQYDSKDYNECQHC